MATTDRQRREHEAAQWIARRDIGPWTDAEAASLVGWLDADIGNRAAYYRLNSAWQEAGRLKALVGKVPTRQLNSRWAIAHRPVYWGIAASVLIATALVAWFLKDHFLGEDYSTIVGGLQAIPMPDGSKVTLNTDSEVQVRVTAAERRVELKHGEAFFEVAKDPKRPFVVGAGPQRIVAVGTAFSVRRLGNDVRVLVTEGKVRVEVPEGEAVLKQPLSAGLEARTAGREVLVQTKPATEIEQNLSWRSGVLTFRNTPLAEAVSEFNRYNTRQIVIEDPGIAAIEIGGIFRATNLDPFVKLLQDGFPIRAIAQQDRIALRRRR